MQLYIIARRVNILNDRFWSESYRYSNIYSLEIWCWMFRSIITNTVMIYIYRRSLIFNDTAVSIREKRNVWSGPPAGRANYRRAPCNKSWPWARYQCTRLLITGPVTDGAVRARSEPVRLPRPTMTPRTKNKLWTTVCGVRSIILWKCVFTSLCVCVCVYNTMYIEAEPSVFYTENDYINGNNIIGRNLKIKTIFFS